MTIKFTVWCLFWFGFFLVNNFLLRFFSFTKMTLLKGSTGNNVFQNYNCVINWKISSSLVYNNGQVILKKH